MLPPSPKECRNEKDKERKKTLVCVADGFYPDHVTVSWKIGNEAITEGVATDTAAKLSESKDSYSITSRLRVHADEWYNPTEKFTCIVSYLNGSITKTYEYTIHGEQGMFYQK